MGSICHHSCDNFSYDSEIANAVLISQCWVPFEYPAHDVRGSQPKGMNYIKEDNYSYIIDGKGCVGGAGNRLTAVSGSV